MSRAKRASAPQTGESAAWWTVGAPCAVVIGMLLLGAVLRSPADGGQSIEALAVGTRTPVDLAARATEDALRLEEHRQGWTLQFLMACDRRNLEPLVSALDDQPALFLLRYPASERECYRVCWGHYESKAEAEHPRAYPDALSQVKAIPWATPVANVLP
jgi:hypothetical protein